LASRKASISPSETKDLDPEVDRAPFLPGERHDGIRLGKRAIDLLWPVNAARRPAVEPAPLRPALVQNRAARGRRPIHFQ
jgi:hypothetical protein